MNRPHFPFALQQCQQMAVQYDCRVSEIVAAIRLMIDPAHPARPAFGLVGKQVSLIWALNVVTDWDFVDV